MIICNLMQSFILNSMVQKYWVKTIAFMHLYHQKWKCVFYSILAENHNFLVWRIGSNHWQPFSDGTLAGLIIHENVTCSVRELGRRQSACSHELSVCNPVQTLHLYPRHWSQSSQSASQCAGQGPLPEEIVNSCINNLMTRFACQIKCN